MMDVKDALNMSGQRSKTSNFCTFQVITLLPA